MERFAEYTYHIGGIWEKDRWIFIEDPDETGWHEAMMACFEYEGPIEFLLRIVDRCGWTIVEVGIQQYAFREDPLGLKYQFDDLFGFTVEYKKKADLQNALAFLEQFVG